jgi:hypothetical protein
MMSSMMTIVYCKKPLYGFSMIAIVRWPKYEGPNMQAQAGRPYYVGPRRHMYWCLATQGLDAH